MNNKNGLTLPGKGIISLLAILVIVLASVVLIFGNFKISPKTTQEGFTKYEQLAETDEVEDIEKDLNNTEFEDKDSEIAQIESELEASLNTKN